MEISSSLVGDFGQVPPLGKVEFIRINRSPVLQSWSGKLKLVLLSCTLQVLTGGLVKQQLSGPFQNDKLVHALIEFKLSTYSLIS